MKHKLLSILLCLAMALSLLPTAALADEGEAARTGDLTYTTANETISGFTYTSGKMTINAENVTVENVTFGDGARLEVNTSGNFTLKNCTFNGKTDVRTPVTLNVGSATVTGNTFNGTKTDGTPTYYNAIEFAVNSGNKLSSATLSNNIFEAAIKNNYFSTYYYADDAVITAENNVIKLANRGSNAIRISNVTNSNVTFNLNNNSYEFSDASGSSEYEGFIILQDFTKKSGNAEDFSKVTINISNLTSPSDASRLFYVWEDSVGLVSDNNPVIRGDSSIEKFFAAKVGDTYYKTLADAVKAVKDNETITLLGDVNLSSNLIINNGKIFTIDLNGKTVNGGTDFYAGDLTIKNGTVEGTVWVNASATDAEYNHLTVAADATIGKGGYAVVLYQVAADEKNFGSTIDVYGKLNGILWVMGNIKTDLKTAQNPCVINVHDGAEIEDKTDATNVGIALNGAAILNVDKAMIAGSTGIEVRAGQMTLNGATVTGKAAPTVVKPNGDGVTTDGAGIAVAQHTTKLPIEVTINSGTISGYTAFYESNPQNNAAEDLAKINIAVKGGEFKTINGGTNTVYSADKTGFITGGTFTGVTAENYLDKGCKLENGKVVPADDSVAKIGNKGYKTLAEALNAVKKTGGTITLLKDTNLSDAEYYIDKSVTINGPGKISCKVKTGEATRAFVVEKNGSLTLDGVELDIQGRSNPDPAKKNDGTGIDVQFGGKLVLQNQAVLKLHDLNRGTIFSEPTGSPATPGQVVINNSTFESTNIDGNASNGGDWTVTNGSTVTINHCGSYGLSVNSLTTEQSTVNISGTSYSAIYGKKLQFKNGSNVLISGAGTKLSFESPSSAAKSPLQTDKDGGTIVVESGATVTVRNCVDKNKKANDTIYLPNNTTYTNNGTVNATIITADAPADSFVVTLVSDGKTIGVQTVAKDSVFTLPAAPEKNNYTFNGWYDGSKFYAAGASYKVSATVTLNASWSYNYSGGSSSYDPTYSVSTPSKTKNGSVTVSPKSASKGDTVTVTVKPDSGYVLETLTVADKNGNELTLKDKGNGKYTFTMPAGKVEVKATFMEDNSMLNFFYDVPNNAYFYEAVKWAVKNGITTGVGNDLFAPEQPCTRAQIVTFLWRAAGSPEPKAASSFADVAAGSYYAKAVAWAVENGITTGTGDGKFSPDATCTRAQAVTFLARALSAKASGKAEFSDVPADSYFADAVAWAAANGVTEGIGGGLFGSDNDCTRGQIVTFLYRAYNK